LLPALDALVAVIDARAAPLADTVKTGRTHLMDAMPVTFGQELDGWSAQLRQGTDGLRGVLPRLQSIAQGGTAVGTGVNAQPRFAQRFATLLEHRSGIAFRPAVNFFAAQSDKSLRIGSAQRYSSPGFSHPGQPAQPGHSSARRRKPLPR